jgi:hypothetical protein
MVHNGSALFLKYFVKEPHVRSVNSEFNSSVWEDSCVEFFFSPEGANGYYNFEINATGALLGAYGPDRNNRQWQDISVLQKVKTYPSLGKDPVGEIATPTSWDILVEIPVEVFVHHQIRNLDGLKGKANFYKCGDKLPGPHFLSWNKVDVDKPDFHLPVYFGPITFE